MLAVLVFALSSYAQTFDRFAPCDIPTSPLSTVAAADVNACEALCAASDACGAYTFVSGWDRCKLFAPTTRHVGVRITAGLVANGVVTAQQEDHDNTGKDLESVPRDLPDANACGAACVATAGCVGFSYVEGYRSCWLKRTEGVLVSKAFRCGFRIPSTESQ